MAEPTLTAEQRREIVTAAHAVLRDQRTALAGRPRELSTRAVPTMLEAFSDVDLGLIGSGIPGEDPKLPRPTMTRPRALPTALIPTALPFGIEVAERAPPRKLVPIAGGRFMDEDTGEIVEPPKDTSPAAASGVRTPPQPRQGPSSYEIAEAHRRAQIPVAIPFGIKIARETAASIRRREREARLAALPKTAVPAEQDEAGEEGERTPRELRGRRDFPSRVREREDEDRVRPDFLRMVTTSGGNRADWVAPTIGTINEFIGRINERRQRQADEENRELKRSNRGGWPSPVFGQSDGGDTASGRGDTLGTGIVGSGDNKRLQDAIEKLTSVLEKLTTLIEKMGGGSGIDPSRPMDAFNKMSDPSSLRDGAVEASGLLDAYRRQGEPAGPTGSAAQTAGGSAPGGGSQATSSGAQRVTARTEQRRRQGWGGIYWG